ncbi:MAG: hypothetical protein JWP97_5411 [Labilithrix sp.]|nr:hypothetical protein [Labilithrix sp.]
MPEIRIRVGAVGDASLTTIFTGMAEAARRARASVQGEFDKLGAGIGAATAKGAGRAAGEADKSAAAQARAAERAAAAQVRAAERAAAAEAKARAAGAKATEKARSDELKATEKAAAAGAKAAEKAEAEKTRALEAAAKNRQRIQDRSAEMAGRLALKGVDDAEKAEKAKSRLAAAWQREQARSAAAEKRTGARRQDADWRAQDRGFSRSNAAVARVVGRVASGALDMGTRVGGDLLRGIGVETSLAGMFGQGVGLEKQAVDLSNAGYMPGKAGAAGKRQDAGELVAQVRQVSTATGMDPTKAMEGLQAFVGKTGDLQTGRDVLAEMAKLSRATGASLEDMTSAAGDVANGLGDVPDKAARVAEVMRSAAAMGKEGAVEVKDLATQMAKLQAGAAQFTGGGAKNMGDMVALAQMSRAKGGSASATQAATSVASFVSTFDKGARLDKFDKYGVKVKGEDGQNRRSIDIIVDALKATNGDSRKMGEMFASEGTKRVTRGFQTIYNEAGGGDAGAAAVRKAFEDLASATMSGKEINESFAASMNTTEARVQVFNNQMAATGDQVRSNLMPALVALAPAVLSATKSLAELVGKLTGKTENDNDDAGRGADQKTLEDRMLLNRGVHEGAVDPKALAAGDEDVSAMARQIAIKKKQIADNEMAPVTKQLLTGWGGQAIVKAGEEKKAIDEQSLASMVEEQRRMSTLLHDIRSGVLKVRVENAHEMKSPAAPAQLPGRNPAATSPAGAKIVHS